MVYFGTATCDFVQKWQLNHVILNLAKIRFAGEKPHFLSDSQSSHVLSMPTRGREPWGNLCRHTPLSVYPLVSLPTLLLHLSAHEHPFQGRAGLRRFNGTTRTNWSQYNSCIFSALFLLFYDCLLLVSNTFGFGRSFHPHQVQVHAAPGVWRLQCGDRVYDTNAVSAGLFSTWSTPSASFTAAIAAIEQCHKCWKRR